MGVYERAGLTAHVQIIIIIIISQLKLRSEKFG
jgi:hypothetical protein